MNELEIPGQEIIIRSNKVYSGRFSKCVGWHVHARGLDGVVEGQLNITTKGCRSHIKQDDLENINHRISDDLENNKTLLVSSPKHDKKYGTRFRIILNLTGEDQVYSMIDNHQLITSYNPDSGIITDALVIATCIPDHTRFNIRAVAYVPDKRTSADQHYFKRVEILNMRSEFIGKVIRTLNIKHITNKKIIAEVAQ